jgi:hypothetical protein
MMAGSDDHWESRLHPKSRGEFDLVGTSRTVVICETYGAPRVRRVGQVLHQYTDSNRRDTLRYEWSFARCCHLVVCLVILDR